MSKRAGRVLNARAALSAHMLSCETCRRCGSCSTQYKLHQAYLSSYGSGGKR